MPRSYAADIRPKFRETDIACMTPRRILVDSATWMCDPSGQFGYDDHGNARVVLERLQAGDMPPDAPWSPEWVATFEAWMSDGFRP
jgi:hypothetical protein